MEKESGGGSGSGSERPAAAPEEVELVRPDAKPADPDPGASEARLVRKLDMFLIPLVMLLYLFSFLDR